MTRHSAHTIKRNRSGSNIRSEPREGTMVRRYFDLAITGQWFDLHDIPMKKRGGILSQLRLSYELELVHRTHPQATHPFLNERQHRCIGRWDGADLRSLEDVEIALNHTLQGE